MSSLKEPYFFSRIQMRHRPFPKDEGAYLALFASGQAARWRGEASTAYFWDEGSPHKIKSVSPDARILISLRDPVARAYSGYWHAVRFAGERRSFLEAIRAELDSADEGDQPSAAAQGAPSYVTSGRYAAALARYMSVFGDRVHVVFFEELVADPRREMRKIFGFLGVDQDFADRLVLTQRNPSVAPRSNALRVLLDRQGLVSRGQKLLPASLRRHLTAFAWRSDVPEMEPATREFLKQLYEDERPRLEALLGRSLSW
jgi:hypothetical protein